MGRKTGPGMSSASYPRRKTLRLDRYQAHVLFLVFGRANRAAFASSEDFRAVAELLQELDDFFGFDDKDVA